MFCLSAIVKVVCAVVVALFEGILPSKISSDLRLASIHREKGVRNLCYFISRVDFCHNGYLYFFVLPAGFLRTRYRSSRYKSVVEKHLVMPGKQKDFRVAELTPEKNEA